MTDTPIRLSPSGPVIGKVGTPGPGARIRLTEATSTMGGSQAIPTVPDVIGVNGFGAPPALVLTLDAPKEALSYRANLALDVRNTATSPGGEVVLYLDVSIDGLRTDTNQSDHPRRSRGGGSQSLHSSVSFGLRRNEERSLFSELKSAGV